MTCFPTSAPLSTSCLSPAHGRDTGPILLKVTLHLCARPWAPSLLQGSHSLNALLSLCSSLSPYYWVISSNFQIWFNVFHLKKNKTQTRNSFESIPLQLLSQLSSPLYYKPAKQNAPLLMVSNFSLPFSLQLIFYSSLLSMETALVKVISDLHVLKSNDQLSGFI